MLTDYFNGVLEEFEKDFPSVKVKYDKSKKSTNVFMAGSKIYSTFKNQIKKDKKHWYCYHCTFANKKKNKKCEMCQKKKKIMRWWSDEVVKKEGIIYYLLL